MPLHYVQHSMVTRSAWTDPVGVMALPAAREGWFYVAYIGNEYPHAHLIDETDMDGVLEYAAERGGGYVPSFSAPSIPYLKNPWPLLDKLCAESGAGLDYELPGWFDNRPFDELRALYPAHTEPA